MNVNLINMGTKKFTQFGTFSVVILSVVLIIFVLMAFTIGLTDTMSTIIFSIIALILFISLLFFYKIDIEIDRVHITFNMGIGIVGKSYNISEIESCKPVKNSFLYGWGIHKIPNGWLYNVSGMNSIELTFKNTDKIVRIGTNKSEEITEMLTKLINVELKSEDNTPVYQIKSQTKNVIIFLIVVAAIILGFNYYNSMPININMKEKQFEITGVYGLPINYSDISAIDTIKQMPLIEMRTNGFASGKVCKGHFTLKETGGATLFINFNISPFVQLIQKNGRVFYFNLKDNQSTIEAFEKIKSRIDSTK